jgi:hypothetical protein
VEEQLGLEQRSGGHGNEPLHFCGRHLHLRRSCATVRSWQRHLRAPVLTLRGAAC